MSIDDLCMPLVVFLGQEDGEKSTGVPCWCLSLMVENTSFRRWWVWQSQRIELRAKIRYETSRLEIEARPQPVASGMSVIHSSYNVCKSRRLASVRRWRGAGAERTPSFGGHCK